MDTKWHDLIEALITHLEHIERLADQIRFDTNEPHTKERADNIQAAARRAITDADVGRSQ